MKENRIKVVIKATPQTLFEFTLDPKNTPKWVPSIVEEIAEEFPPRVGTKYKNRGLSTEWDWYQITDISSNTTFTMADLKSNYHVRYTFTPVSTDETELEYFEWMEEGELPNPFTMEPLFLLKSVIESTK